MNDENHEPGGQPEEKSAVDASREMPEERPSEIVWGNYNRGKLQGVPRSWNNCVLCVAQYFFLIQCVLTPVSGFRIAWIYFSQQRILLAGGTLLATAVAFIVCWAFVVAFSRLRKLPDGERAH